MSSEPQGGAGGARGAERDAREFGAWNEEMVRRYDIERYYERSHPIVRWVEARRLKALRDLAAARPGDRLLEVGCGAGHVLDGFAQARRFGADLSETMLGRARRRLGGEVPLLRGNAERLPYADGSFDVVVCTEVLEHTQQPAEVLAELMRVAAPGGRVVVSIPNEANIDRAKHALARVPLVGRRLLATLASEANEWHLHHFDRRMLERLVDGVAEIREVRGVPFGALPLRYVARLARPGDAA